MNNNYQNPQLQQIQMQPMHSQHYQPLNPVLGGPNGMNNLNSPIIQNQNDLQFNQLKSPQHQQTMPKQMLPNQSQNYNQPHNNMIRRPPHSKYFYKGNIDYPSYPTFLPIEKFGELLLKAYNSFKEINFESVYVDKPKG